MSWLNSEPCSGRQVGSTNTSCASSRHLLLAGEEQVSRLAGRETSLAVAAALGLHSGDASHFVLRTLVW